MKARLATMWLGGCSGCHMSFLDLDEGLLDLLQNVELVYGPLVDVKEFPSNVDLTLVEGAVANRDHLELLLRARENSRVLVSFGDCAVTGNVTALRNLVGPIWSGPLDPLMPPLLETVHPLHHYVTVDYYLAGCPPSPQRIAAVVSSLLAGEEPQLSAAERRFG